MERLHVSLVFALLRVHTLRADTSCTEAIGHEDRANEGLYVIPPIDDNETVTYLDLRGNRLTAIGKDALSGFSCLKHLNSRNNCISTIEENVFCDTDLRGLDLGFNLLTQVPQLGCVDNLVKLNLDGNGITELHHIRFEPFTNLRNLSVRHNFISHIEVDDFGMTPIRKLYLGCNLIRCLRTVSSTLLLLLILLSTNINVLSLTGLIWIF